jgi:OOP family OmpA-OmpF porin
MKRILRLISVALLLTSATARAQSDAKGCKDSPLINRFPGSVLTDCTDKPDDRFSFAIDGKPDKIVEGEYHQLRYDFSKVASKAEVARNLKVAFKSGGFALLHDTDAGYYTAQAGKNWISAEVNGGNYVLTIVVEIPLRQLVKADASAVYPQMKSDARPTPEPDAKGCKDSPLITRFPGSVLTDCDDKPDDRFNFGMGSGKPDKVVEGDYHRLRYDFSKVASKAEVIRNLKTALHTGGFTLVYDSGDAGYYTAQAGKNWVGVEVNGGNYVLTVVVEKKLEQLVAANADALYSGLKTNGHMPVYGVFFDTGKADLKPESAPALTEVARLVRKDPSLKLYVVGHTDNVGSVSSNLDLSQRRAGAVQKALTTQYGVPASALMGSFGAGPYCPVAANETEDGRAHNRRVELVQQ